MNDSAAAAGQAPLEVSLAYYQAWTAKDFDHAMTFIADNIVVTRRAAGWKEPWHSARLWSRSRRS